MNRTSSVLVPPGFEVAACPKCGEREAARPVVQGRDWLHGSGGTYTAAECARCGLWFQNPRPALEQLARLYPVDYLPHHADQVQVKAPHPGMVRYLRRWLGYADLKSPGEVDEVRFDWMWSVPSTRWRRWSAAVALIPQFVPDGRLLELGCATGNRLAVLRSLGWTHLSGIELVEVAARRAIERGFPVVIGPLERAIDEQPDRSLDVVVTGMVLEHLHEPFQVVRQVAAKLKPGAQFLFSTVVRESLDARLYGPYWGGFDFPRHMVYLRKQDIEDMLRDHFEDVEWVHQTAPQDLYRPAAWRRREGRVADRFVLGLHRTGLLSGIDLLLAWAGQTCRISVRCRRRA